MSEEVQREAIRTINSCETLEKTEFEKNLFASYEAHHLENDIVSGLVENILIVPRIRYFAESYENSSPRHTDTWKDITRRSRGEYIATQSETEPFTPDVDPHLTTIYWKDVEENTVPITSFDELFTKDIDTGSYIRVNADDDCWVIGQVEYTLMGELNTESMLDSKLVCLDSDFSLSNIPRSPEDHTQIDFTSNADGTFKFRYSDTSWYKPFSYSTGRTVEWLSIMNGSVLFLWGFTSLISQFMPVSYIEYIIGIIVLVKLYGYVNRDWFDSIRKNEFSDMSLVDEDVTVTGLGIVEAKSMRDAQMRKRNVVNGVRERVKHLPKEVTITPETKKLTVDDAGVSTEWNLNGSPSDKGVYSAEAVEFFVELGFEDVDGDSFTGYIVRSQSEYAGSVEGGLESTGGTWVLSPNPIEYKESIEISDVE